MGTALGQPSGQESETDADIKPILGGVHIDEVTGRVWQPEDTDKATGPFVIGKLARDGVEAPTFGHLW